MNNGRLCYSNFEVKSFIALTWASINVTCFFCLVSVYRIMWIERIYFYFSQFYKYAWTILYKKEPIYVSIILVWKKRILTDTLCCEIKKNIFLQKSFFFFLIFWWRQNMNSDLSLKKHFQNSEWKWSCRLILSTHLVNYGYVNIMAIPNGQTYF